MISKVPKWFIQFYNDTSRFRKAWDYGCVSYDAWLAGYKYCKDNHLTLLSLDEIVDFEHSDQFKNGTLDSTKGFFIGYISNKDEAKKAIKSLKDWMMKNEKK